MDDSENWTFNDDAFAGRVRLFPLPNLVMFPFVMRALHIFEPRYRAMFEEAIATDQLLTMAILAPGWENNYQGRPAIEQVACLSRIATYHRVEDGSYNVLIQGIRRVRIVEELPPSKLFREARVEILSDRLDENQNVARLQRELLDGFKHLLPNLAEPQEQLEYILSRRVPLGMLTDIIADTLDNPRLKLALLADTDVCHRCRMLLEFMRPLQAAADGPARSKFPPDFSSN